MKRIPKLHLTQVNRFWRQVDMSGGPRSCWLWTGFTREAGYGSISIRYQEYKAHRVSYFLAHGRIDDGLLVLHRCDVRACVNPKHLYQGTPKENSQDAVRKGRNTKIFGEHNGNHKLTAVQVRAIRRLCRQDVLMRKTIARRFGVSEATIHYIAHGSRWKQVD